MSSTFTKLDGLSDWRRDRWLAHTDVHIVDTGPCLAEEQSNIKFEDPEALQMPGASDGATKVIKEQGGTMAAYAWSQGTSSWQGLPLVPFLA